MSMGEEGYETAVTGILSTAKVWAVSAETFFFKIGDEDNVISHTCSPNR